MIYCIKGVINSITDSYLVVMCNDIGYRLMYYSSDLILGNTYSFYILTISNDNNTFYIGYIDENEMLFYKELLDIKGIGVRTIINLSKYDYKELYNYIKIANHAVIRSKYNLSDKTINAIIEKFNIKMKKDNNLIDILVGLGYKKQDVLDNYDRLNAISIEDNLLLAARIIGNSYE